MLDRFAGKDLAKKIRRDTNHPCNAINMEVKTHASHDRLVWGIEAEMHGTQVNMFLTAITIHSTT